MAAAARAGDATSHGGSLPGALGSSNVKIGGKAAWRMAPTDLHQCSLSTGNVPHVGGPVVGGSTKVFINGFPAARQGDLIAETGPSNSITGGFKKVEIK